MRDLQASELNFVYGAGGSSKCAPTPKCGKGGSSKKHSSKKHSSKKHSSKKHSSRC